MVGNYIGEVEKGDAWYFLFEHPHSIQGLGKGGCEFVLTFENGNFSKTIFIPSNFISEFDKFLLCILMLANIGNRKYPNRCYRRISVLRQRYIFINVSKLEKYVFQGSIPGLK